MQLSSNLKMKQRFRASCFVTSAQESKRQLLLHETLIWIRTWTDDSNAYEVHTNFTLCSVFFSSSERCKSKGMPSGADCAQSSELCVNISLQLSGNVLFWLFHHSKLWKRLGMSRSVCSQLQNAKLPRCKWNKETSWDSRSSSWSPPQFHVEFVDVS